MRGVLRPAQPLRGTRTVRSPIGPDRPGHAGPPRRLLELRRGTSEPPGPRGPIAHGRPRSARPGGPGWAAGLVDGQGEHPRTPAPSEELGGPCRLRGLARREARPPWPRVLATISYDPWPMTNSDRVVSRVPAQDRHA